MPSMTATLTPAPAFETNDDFSALHREIRARGLLQPRPGWYARSIAVTTLCWLALAAVMVLIGPSWWQLLCAAVAAVLSARIAFLGHDAGHQQITRSRRVNRLIGLVHGNLLIGMSYGWWVAKHNKHHAHPNDLARDPDVGPGAIAWTPGQAASRRTAAGRWLAGHQAALFFPLLLLEGINLKLSSIRDLWARPERRAERRLLLAHYCGYLSFLFVLLSPWQAVAFVGVHQALFGLHLGSAFAPNHKGMPMPPPGQSWGHFRQQVCTSRNVTGGPVRDWLLGGLNYQIEHHLFPSMARPNLRRAQPIVRRHCAAAGLPYTEQPALASYRRALAHLAAATRGGGALVR